MPEARDPLGRVLGDLNPALFGDPVNELALFRGCRTIEDVRAVFREEVGREVAAMASLVEDADAFDVIELMRMREFAPVPDPRIIVADGSALVIEIVAAVLLARSGRKPSPIPRVDTRPHENVTDLHERAQRLSRLATYRHMLEAQMNQDPLAQIAAEYQSAVLQIRNLQYDTIRDRHEAELFNHPVVADLMSTHLGYGYDDVLAVRNAMTRLSGERMTRLRNESADILLQHQGTPVEEVPPEALDAFMDLIKPFVFLPADRAVITAADVAEVSGLRVDRVAAVLDSYSQTFDDSRSPVDGVIDMLIGENPFLITPLITDGGGSYVCTTNDVGLDSLRRILEAALPTNSADVRRYDQKARQIISERLALKHLETILRAPPAYAGFKYFAPAKDLEVAVVDADCTELNAVANQTEGDGLFLIDDVAVCVEVKGKSIAAQTRRGDVRRLSRDLKATIGDASDQAVRLQNLIEGNGGIWLGDRSWLDLSHVREVRSIVVLLDDVGPLSTAIGELQRVGIVPRKRPPWITSLHDLATVAEISGRPSEFLLYLRRRTDSGVTTYYRAADELDLYMLFMEGGLYVASDPEQTRAEHPTTPPVRSRDRRDHARDAVGTMVLDHCQELNAWMQRHQVEEHNGVPGRPAFNAPDRLVDLIDELDRRDAPGAFRTSADLLSLSGDVQQEILKIIAERARTTRRDGEFHEVMLAFAGMWGYMTLFIATAPTTGSWEFARKRLHTYMSAKKHQVKADRAFGLLFDENVNLAHVFYMNAAPTDDPQMDALVTEMGLQPIGDATPRPVPPYARRGTRRLRGKRKKS